MSSNGKAYDGYGNRVAGTAPPSRFGFAAAWGYEGTDLGLQYLDQRYYDPAAGRFISRDPIRWAGGLNLYGYCDADPINLIDPSGLDAGWARRPQEHDPYGYKSSRTVATFTVPRSIMFWLGSPKPMHVAITAPTKREAVDGLTNAALGSLLIVGRGLSGPAILGIPEGEGACLAQGEGNAVQRIWSSTGKLTSIRNAWEHFLKHRAEFPEFFNAKQYVDAARDFVANPPAGTLTKTRSNGDVLFYNEKTNTFAVRAADGAPRTMFRPAAGIKYWNAQ